MTDAGRSASQVPGTGSSADWPLVSLRGSWQQQRPHCPSMGGGQADLRLMVRGCVLPLSSDVPVCLLGPQTASSLMELEAWSTDRAEVPALPRAAHTLTENDRTERASRKEGGHSRARSGLCGTASHPGGQQAISLCLSRLKARTHSGHPEVAAEFSGSEFQSGDTGIPGSTARVGLRKMTRIREAVGPGSGAWPALPSCLCLSALRCCSLQ